MSEEDTREEFERLLTPGEVAEIFRVNPQTVRRWAMKGWLTNRPTLGGHSRFLQSEVVAILNGSRPGRKQHPPAN